MFVIKVGVTYY